MKKHMSIFMFMYQRDLLGEAEEIDELLVELFALLHQILFVQQLRTCRVSDSDETNEQINKPTNKP